MKKSRRNGLYRQLVVATLLMGGTFNLAAPVLAAGTAASTGISNTATATYEDPNNPGTINATSNTVTITVAEVAGITAVPLGVNDGNGGSVSPGDTLEYNFRLTNVGNAPTNIFIPGQITATNLTNYKVYADLNNDGDFVDVGEEINATNGLTTSTPIPADGSIQVRVIGTVASNATSGTEVRVRLGNTAPNDNTAATQNQPLSNLTGLDEIRTVNITGSETPANGEREASVFDKVTVSSQANQKRALATIRETSTHTPGTTDAKDDKITYNLDLKVEGTSPNASFIPGDLEGTTINLDGSNSTHILVSDAIPTGTVFDPSVTPVAPSNWTVVYSTTPINGASDDPLAAQWKTFPSGGSGIDPTTIKRIGFIYTAGTSLPTNTTVNGFRFGVITSTMPDSGGTVANIAQIFGETKDDPTNTIVYDESGDSQPNNFNSDGTTPYPDGAGGFDPNTDNGKADPTTQGTDNNNNTGSGVDGEANVVSIAATPVPISDLLNGPASKPEATGSGNSNNTDFFNKSVTNVPLNRQTAFDPAAVSFNNTFKNSGTSKIDNLVLKPIAPSQADSVVTGDQSDRNTGFGNNTQLPINTKVIITYNSSTASYTWDGSNFTLDSGSSPIRLSNIAAGTTIDYTVNVDLAGSNPQLQAFPVAIAAFVDQDGNNNFDRTTDTPGGVEPFFNVTVDRVYTGFMEMTKQARLLNADSTPVTGADGQFNSTPSFKPQPTQIIEYQISYKNLSTPASAGGNGSVLLNANNFKLFEDGGANGNNWAANTTHVMTKAIATTGASTINYYGTTINPSNPGTGVVEADSNTGYVNTVGTVAPNTAGTFTFQRKVK